MRAARRAPYFALSYYLARVVDAFPLNNRCARAELPRAFWRDEVCLSDADEASLARLKRGVESTRINAHSPVCICNRHAHSIILQVCANIVEDFLPAPEGRGCGIDCCPAILVRHDQLDQRALYPGYCTAVNPHYNRAGPP